MATHTRNDLLGHEVIALDRQVLHDGLSCSPDDADDGLGNLQSLGERRETKKDHQPGEHAGERAERREEAHPLGMTIQWPQLPKTAFATMPG